MFEDTIANWLQISSGLLLPAIALLGAWIAFQQYQTNRGALKEKLFERRFDVFKDVQVFLHGILRDAAVADTSWPPFHSALQRGRFLFGADVNAYLEEIRSHASKMGMAVVAMQSPTNEDDRLEQIAIKYEQFTWLTSQLDEMFVKFDPYLGFARHK